MWVNRSDYNDVKYNLSLLPAKVERLEKEVDELRTINNLLLERLKLVVDEEPSKPSKKVLITKAEKEKRIKTRYRNIDPLERQKILMAQQSAILGLAGCQY
jgi:hypothetical protein